MILAICVCFGGLLTRADSPSSATADVVELREVSFVYHAWAAMMVSEFTALPLLKFNPEGYGDGVSFSGHGFLSAYGLDSEGLSTHLAALGGITAACVLLEVSVAGVFGGQRWGRARS